MAIKTMFVPFGELLPDGKLFNNDGLLVAKNVVPVHGNYIASQHWTKQGDEPADQPYGLHTHFAGGSTWYGYLGTITKLYQANTSLLPIWTLVDKSRTVGGAYATSAAGGENGWQGTSFGDNIIMTNYVDDPQLLTSPSVANFVKLAQSGSGNPGMDPKAKFVYVVKGNLHLANLNLAAAFDGLPIGANPTVVCWSQTENARQFGSQNVTPQLTGCGYQPLSYDFGHIAGVIGGDYGIVFMQNGIVREDGPPYTFRPIVVGQGTRFPNSIVRYDDDVYFWGVAGPSRLRGGEGPVEVLGDTKVRRTLIDNNASTGFSPTFSLHPNVLIRHVTAGRDIANSLVWWSFTSISRVSAGAAVQYGDMSVIYNVSDGRFSFVENREGGAGTSGVVFLRNAPDLGGSWAPGRDLVGVVTFIDLGTNRWGLAIPYYDAAGAALPTMTRAYQQLNPNNTTRVISVRPIYSRGGLFTSVPIVVTVNSKNKPYESPIVSVSSTPDSHDRYVFPTSPHADFHQVSLAIEGNATQTIVELEGFELEYDDSGPRYAA